MPRTVVAVDYGRRGDLYVRFKHVAKPIGSPAGDGLVLFFYEDGQRIVAVEIMDVSRFSEDHRLPE